MWGGALARAKGHVLDSDATTSLAKPAAGVLPSTLSSPSPVGEHSEPHSGPAPTPAPLLAPSAALTWLGGRKLRDSEAVHLAKVAGQQAHACRGQDHGAQAPKSALGGERRAADRVGLGEHGFEPGAFGRDRVGPP